MSEQCQFFVEDSAIIASLIGFIYEINDNSEKAVKGCIGETFVIYIILGTMMHLNDEFLE